MQRIRCSTQPNLKIKNQNSKLLIATTNPGKFSEFKEIFKELRLGIELISLKDVGINQKIEERGKTFKENAIQKAKFYHSLSGLPTLADDGGLEIDYLNGEPGVKSRRWPGYEASDEELIKFTLEKLKGVPKPQRGARLRAVIALVFPGKRKVYTFEGVLKGRIGEKLTKKIITGYPFRSLFIPENQEKYLGELSLVAHRKKAVKRALPLLKLMGNFK